MDPTPYETTLQQIEIVHAMIRRYPDTFQLALTSEDVVKSINNGKLASLMGAEGGHSIENSLEKL
jgi:membrane dipeptidase